MKVRYMCDCASDCTQTVVLHEETIEAIRSSGKIIIVDSCRHGPENSDVLFEQRKGYAVYTPLIPIPA